MGIVEPYAQQLTQWLSSSNLHRKVVKFIIGLVVLVLLIGISLVAYLSFYWIYIPQRGHVGQVYLQYARPTVPNVIGEGPFAQVDFTSGGRYSQFLRAEQAYDISVNLHVPASESNMEIGNFMVKVTLARKDGREIATASRPAIMTYQSTPLKLMRTAWKAVPLVLEWSKEDQIIKVPLFENFVEDPRNPVGQARIQISTPALQVYSSSIHIDAHFHGLRYFMYYYKVSTALVFMTVFIFWEIVFSILTWQLLNSWFGTDAETLVISHQIQSNVGAQGGQSGHAGQKQQQQSLLAPTAYSSNTTSASRKKALSTASPHRQPQLSEQGYGSDSDAEFEEEQNLLSDSHSRGRKGDDPMFEHDEMEEDEDVDQDQDLRHLESQNRRPTYIDEAVVPENPSTSSQRRHGAGVTSSRSRTSQPQQQQQQPQQQRTTTTTTTTSQQQRGGESFLSVDDGFSVAGSSSTSGTRRTGASGMDVSMTSSSNVYPPPPPPSVFSDLTSELVMPNISGGNSRRTAVESEYTEEDDEYLEDDAGADDDDEDDNGDISFEEEDFSEAGLLSRSGTVPRSVRSRHVTERRHRENVTAASSGRSTGRSGA
ncbi:Berardinelli-Seip congenital lipodystrophy 2 (seipin) [Haplosporangium sp. Z 11]|nr:Berardinelli-Seip congenital lipodystrophy 2 (seipin) [Haplosporangium sp. Z 11]